MFSERSTLIEHLFKVNNVLNTLAQKHFATPPPPPPPPPKHCLDVHLTFFKCCCLFQLLYSSPRRPSGQDPRDQMSPLHSLTLLNCWFLLARGERNTISLFNTVKLLWHNLHCKKRFRNMGTWLENVQRIFKSNISIMFKECSGKVMNKRSSS